MLPQGGDPVQPDPSREGERRRKPRFAMHCSIFLRTLGASGEWIRSETANVSTVGAYFASKVELPRDRSVEYVLTFPPELTHAPAPWRVRFYGSVVRVEAQTAGQGTYGVAVYTTKHHYLSPEESEAFCGLDELQGPTAC
jgi:hypothetical protein